MKRFDAHKYIEDIKREIINNPGASNREISKTVNNGKTDAGKRQTVESVRKIIIKANWVK